MLSGKLMPLACSLYLVMMATACKKPIGDNKNLDPKNQVQNDYMSTKPGSWWLFGAEDGSVFRRMATGRDSVKNGLLFSYYETLDTNTGNITPEYFGKNGDKYLGLFDVDGKKENYIVAVLLRDSVNPGDTWSNTERYQNQYDVLIESTVIRTGEQLTLNGQLYENVTEVNNNVKGKALFMANYIDIGRINVWFARGVGLIKEDVDVNIAGLFKMKHKDSILAYHIEPE